MVERSFNKEVTHVAISEIRSIRCSLTLMPPIDAETVKRYLSMFEGGETVEPLVVFRNNEGYWLSRGYHILEAAKLAGRKTIAVEVIAGTVRDACVHHVFSKYFSSSEEEDKGQI